MIEFIIGKPGDGKTMFAVRRMLEHFRILDARPIVSNVRLDNPACVDWLVANSNQPADFWYWWLKGHYFPLKDEHTCSFFRYRGELVLTEETDVEAPGFAGMKNGKEILYPNYKLAGSVGVVYYLDEVHTAFPSDLLNISPHVLHYLSQHRKFGDDVFCITQHPEQVSKKFRLLAQTYHRLRNQYRQKFGWFKLPGKFSRDAFSSIPRQGSVSFESESFHLEKEIGKCYDTTAGAGVGGNREPELKRAKGLPMWVFFAGCIALVVGIVLVAKFGAQGFVGLLSAQGPTLEKKASGATAAAAGGAVPSVVPGEVEFLFVAQDGRLFLGLKGGRVIAANGSGHRVFFDGINALVNGEIVEVKKAKS